MKAKVFLMSLMMVSVSFVQATLEERIEQVEKQIAGLIDCVKSDRTGNEGCDMDESCYIYNCDECGGSGSGSGSCSDK